MDELTVRNENTQLSKNVLSSYVHDALEMEIGLVTMNKCRKELKEQIKKVKKIDVTADVKKPMINKKITPKREEVPLPKEQPKLKSLLEETEEDKIKYIRKFREENRSRYFKAGLFTFLLFLIIGIAFVVMLPAVMEETGDAVMGKMLLGMAIIAIGIPILVKIKKANNNKLDDEARYTYSSEIKRKNDEIEAENNREIARARRVYEEKCKQVEEQNEALLAKYKEDCKKAEEENERLRQLDQQEWDAYSRRCNEKKKEHGRLVAMLEKQLSNLDENLITANLRRDKFYSVNIVPIDYRTIPVLLYLDHSFRNDLVDTVRQGIDRYELSEYRNAVLKGLDNISARLDNLSGLMLDLGKRLDHINVQVSMMGNDLYNMAERQAKMQDEMNENSFRALEESRLQRYATEALNRTEEKILEYCKDR